MGFSKWLNDFTDKMAGISGMDKTAAAKADKAREDHLMMVASMSKHNIRVGTEDRPTASRIEIKGSMASGFMNSPTHHPVSVRQQPTDLLEIVGLAEKRAGIRLSAKEFQAISNKIRKDDVAEKATDKLAGIVERMVQHTLQARIGRSIKNSSNVVKPTFRENTTADLEQMTDRERPTPQQEAENVRHVRPDYPPEADARKEDLARNVQDERATSKKISKEKSIDRTMGLSAPGTKPVYPLKGASADGKIVLSVSEKAAADVDPKSIEKWEKSFPPKKKKFRRLKSKSPDIKDRDIVEAPDDIAKMMDGLDETAARVQETEEKLAEKMKGIRKAVQNYQASAEEKAGVPEMRKRIKRDTESRIEEASEMLDSLEGRMPMDVIMAHQGLLMTAQEITQKLSAADLKEVLARLGKMSDKLQAAIDKLIDKVLKEKPDPGVDVMMYPEKKASYKKLAEIVDEIFEITEALQEYLAEVSAIEVESDDLQEDMMGLVEESGEEMDDGFEPEPMPIAASLSDGDIVVSKLNGSAGILMKDFGKMAKIESTDGSTHIIDKTVIEDDYRKADAHEARAFIMKQGTTEKIAEMGRPNDVDRCRDCAYYESGIGTVYHKCAECLRAYTEDNIKEMEKADQDLLKDYFTDRGVTTVNVPAVDTNTPAFEKKHASLRKRAAYTSDNPMFKDLTDEEEAEFRKWAKDNPDKDTPENRKLYHPVIADEYDKMKSGGEFDDQAEGLRKMVRDMDGPKTASVKTAMSRTEFEEMVMNDEGMYNAAKESVPEAEIGDDDSAKWQAYLDEHSGGDEGGADKVDREEIERWVMNDEGMYNMALETVPEDEIGDDDSKLWNDFIEEHGDELSTMIQEVLNRKPVG